MIERESIEELHKILNDLHEERQKRTDQYVIAYRRKNEELIGYHADSFCNLTQNILEAKRYAGEDPYKQLEIVWKNMCYMLKEREEDTNPRSSWLSKIVEIARKGFGGLSEDDIYIDAIYLAEGTSPQRFNLTILNAGQNGTENN